MKKKIIILTAIGLVLILAGGSAFFYMRAPATEDEAALTQAEAEKSLNDEDISDGDNAGERAENQEEEKEEVDAVEVEREKIKKEKAEKKEMRNKQALENLEKERKETLEFLSQYDKETVRKKERSEAISRWLEKKPH